jgi:alanine dehydrogenase
MRTGAAGAVSAKWMARQNSKRLAIVGAGHMAEGALATCNEVFEWDEVRVWSRTQATLDHFMQTQQPKFPHLKIRPSTDNRAGGARRRCPGDGHPGARTDRDG